MNTYFLSLLSKRKVKKKNNRFILLRYNDGSIHTFISESYCGRLMVSVRHHTTSFCLIQTFIPYTKIQTEHKLIISDRNPVLGLIESDHLFLFDIPRINLALRHALLLYHNAVHFEFTNLNTFKRTSNFYHLPGMLVEKKFNEIGRHFVINKNGTTEFLHKSTILKRYQGPHLDVFSLFT
jgi:hypothetical protein